MFADDVRQGLSATPRQLNPAYFYDALGSCLFDAICQLPFYKITRTELAMLDAHAGAIVAGLPDPACLIELGCGNGEKIARLVAALDRAGRRATVHLVDVSASALEQTTHRLARWPGVSVTAHRCTSRPASRRPSRSAARAARHISQVPVTLTSMTLRHSAGSSWS